MYRYQLDDDEVRVVHDERVLCVDPQGARGDNFHLNSIADYNGELVVSMFGPAWTRTIARQASHLDRSHGSVIRVADGEPLARGLYHPHSVCVVGTELLVIESQAHRISRIAGGEPHHWPIVGGYPRGITAAGPDSVWVGVSARRRESVSQGTTNDVAGTGPIDFRCRVVELSLADGSTGRELDLTALGGEVFEVRELPAAAVMTPSEDGGLSQRIEALQASYFDVKHRLARLKRPPGRRAAVNPRRLASRISRSTRGRLEG